MDTQWIATEYKSIRSTDSIRNIFISYNDGNKAQICAKVALGIGIDTMNLTRYYDKETIETVYSMLLIKLSLGDRLINIEDLLNEAEGMNNAFN